MADDDEMLAVFRPRESDTDDSIGDIRDRAREQDLEIEEVEHASVCRYRPDYSDQRWGDVDAGDE